MSCSQDNKETHTFNSLPVDLIAPRRACTGRSVFHLAAFAVVAPPPPVAAAASRLVCRLLRRSRGRGTKGDPNGCLILMVAVSSKKLAIQHQLEIEIYDM